MMRIRSGVGGECLRSALQRGLGPVLEALRRRLLGSHSKKRDRYQRQEPEFFHLYSPQEKFGILRFRIRFADARGTEQQKSGRPPRKGAPILPPCVGLEENF